MRSIQAEGNDSSRPIMKALSPLSKREFSLDQPVDRVSQPIPCYFANGASRESWRTVPVKVGDVSRFSMDDILWVLSAPCGNAWASGAVTEILRPHQAAVWDCRLSSATYCARPEGGAPVRSIFNR